MIQMTCEVCGKHFAKHPAHARVSKHRDRPACVNPDHLFLGTQPENVADCFAKGRIAFGEWSGTAKLTFEDVKAMRETYRQTGVAQNVLAMRYGVSGTTVSKILSEKIWRRVA